jgi:LysM repeat protein
MDPRTRHELARYGAPAAFLAAVTIAVILIKAGLNGGSDTVTNTALPTTARTTTQAQTSTKLVLSAPQATASTTTTETTTPGAEYYTVQSGDTLGSIAQKYGTTVDELAMLNPGIDPAALRIGQRIRVK